MTRLSLPRFAPFLRRIDDARLIPSAARLERMASRHFNGWHTTHPPRLWEYPWVMRQVPRRPNDSAVAVDFGAGRSPVPLALSRRGFATRVVDNDAHGQRGLDIEASNEWRWIDYGSWGITTLRKGMEERIFEAASVHVAVSVSAIEHIPASARRAALAEFGRALIPGGTCVLTIDVEPGTPRLWNRSLGKVVDDEDDHGTVDGLIGEAATAGLEIVHHRVCPIEAEEVGVVGLVFRRS